MTTPTQGAPTSRPFLLSVASLMAFGVAIVCGFMSVAVVGGALNSPTELSAGTPAGINPHTLLIFLGVVYSSVTAGFISIAVGTWRGRWWARNLSITLNSGALLCGGFSLMIIMLNHTEFKSLMGPLPEHADFSLIISLAVAIASALFVALPSGLLWTYLRKPAQQFFISKTPSPNKREPLSLSATKVLAAMMIYGSFFTLFVPMDTFVLGIQASGSAATGIILGRAGLGLAGIVLLFKNRLSGLSILGALELEAILYTPMAILVHGREHYFATISFSSDIASNPATLNLNNNLTLTVITLVHTAIALPIFLRAYRYLKNNQRPTASVENETTDHSTDCA
jgi:hypothetical protein